MLCIFLPRTSNGVKTYELTYIVSSQASPEELDGVRKDLESFIQEKEGVIFKSDKSLPQTFAYRIKKNSSGNYLLVEFQAKEEIIEALKTKIAKEGKILRHHLVIKKPVKALKGRALKRPFRPEESQAHGAEKPAADKNAGKVEIEELSKKLDEILSD